jgi:hypothetical protein
LWISQTYLGEFSAPSKLFIYYFWEDYAKQKNVPAAVQSRLAELGYSFKNEVSVFVPMREYLGHVREEMERKFQKFWWTFKEKTPGLFLCRKSLKDFDPDIDEWFFVPIPNETAGDPEALTAIFKDLHTQCLTLIDKKSNRTTGRFFDALYSSAQLKITFMGAGIDFKPLVSYMLGKKPRSN